MLAESARQPMAMLLRNDAGGLLLRRLLPLAVLVPLILGFLKVQGQRRGLYDTAFGTGLLVIAMAVLFAIAFWRSAMHLSRLTTRETKTYQALRASEERLSLFIEHAPAALAMFDREMRYLSVSRRWLTDYNLGGRDLRGISHYAIFPEITEEWKAAHRRALAGEILQSDADRFARVDGSIQWVRWEIRPWYDARGNIGGILIFTEDVTGHKHAEEALRRPTNGSASLSPASGMRCWPPTRPAGSRS